MSFNQFKKLVTQAATTIEGSEKFALPILAVRAKKQAEAHPYDVTSVGMYKYLTKKAEKETFISRTELKNAFAKLGTTDGLFARAFADELAIKEVEYKPVLAGAAPKKDIVKSAMENTADSFLTHTLTAIFDKVPVTPYTSSMAKQASLAVLDRLNRSVGPRKVEVVGGKSNILVCAATYETPKGSATVLVPVEFQDGTPLVSDSFLSQAGFVSATKENLNSHISATAGKTFEVDVNKMLNILVEPVKQASEMDMIIARSKIAQGTATHTADGILFQTLEKKASAPVEFEDKAQVAEFGARLSTSRGQAEFLHGANANKARNMVVKAMKDFGYNAVNVNVCDSDENKIFLAVAISGKAGFKVAVDGKNPEMPKFAVTAEGLHAFSRPGIAEILSESPDKRAIASASPLYGLKSSELLNTVEASVQAGNMAAAEDALMILEVSDNPEAYRRAFVAYTQGLQGHVKIASTTCASPRDIPYSIHKICSHTNLPLHKVYQNEHGECLPLYRKNQSEVQTVLLNASKIILT